MLKKHYGIVHPKIIVYICEMLKTICKCMINCRSKTSLFFLQRFCFKIPVFISLENPSLIVFVSWLNFWPQLNLHWLSHIGSLETAGIRPEFLVNLSSTAQMKNITVAYSALYNSELLD